MCGDTLRGFQNFLRISSLLWECILVEIEFGFCTNQVFVNECFPVAKRNAIWRHTQREYTHARARAARKHTYTHTLSLFQTQSYTSSNVCVFERESVCERRLVRFAEYLWPLKRLLPLPRRLAGACRAILVCWMLLGSLLFFINTVVRYYWFSAVVFPSCVDYTWYAKAHDLWTLSFLIQKRSHTQKFSPKMANPRDINGNAEEVYFSGQFIDLT